MATTRTPRPFACALDAVEEILRLLDAEPATSLAAFVEHRGGPDRLVVSVEAGDPGPEGVEALAGSLPVLLGPLAGARFVLLSVRDAGGATIVEADLAAWRRLTRLHRLGSPTLLDWFVVTDDSILSLAELGGPPARWDR